MAGTRRFSQLWKKLTRSNSGKDIGLVPSRFFAVFLEHGVEASQIPRLIPSLRLADLSSPAKLLSALTPEIIDQVAHLFGIRSQWLEGVGEQIYDHRGTYKAPAVLLKHISKLVYPSGEEKRDFPLRALCTAKCLDRTLRKSQRIALVLLEPIGEIGEEIIYRYYLYCDGFDWNYAPGRLELKAIARVVFRKLHSPTPLFEITEEEMDAVLEGRVVPRRLMHGSVITNPSLEDYALSNLESGVAKETEELPEVIQVIETHALESFSFNICDEDGTQEGTDAVSATAQGQDPSSPKMRTHQSHDWEAIRSAAQTLWAQDGQLSIAEVIRRIKLVSAIKASVFTESAIRKHIVDLAPSDIRGKSGRKPKKPSSVMTTLIQHQLEK